VFDSLDDAQVQRMLECEHGGLNESFAELFARTGNRRWLALSERARSGGHGCAARHLADPGAGGISHRRIVAAGRRDPATLCLSARAQLPVQFLD
jgi:hypothetical protein